MPRSVFTDAHAAFRQALIAERKALGLTQVQLAERLNKPQSFVSKFERGERRLDVIEFIAVADALDIDATSVLRALLDRLQRPVAI